MKSCPLSGIFKSKSETPPALPFCDEGFLSFSLNSQQGHPSWHLHPWSPSLREFAAFCSAGEVTSPTPAQRRLGGLVWGMGDMGCLTQRAASRKKPFRLHFLVDGAGFQQGALETKQKLWGVKGIQDMPSHHAAWVSCSWSPTQARRAVFCGFPEQPEGPAVVSPPGISSFSSESLAPWKAGGLCLSVLSVVETAQ